MGNAFVNTTVDATNPVIVILSASTAVSAVLVLARPNQILVMANVVQIQMTALTSIQLDLLSSLNQMVENAS